MIHVMTDLETLGTVPGCVILSIGAVAFDPETGLLGKDFYEVINTDSCADHYLSVDPGTVAWWQGQSAEAREVIDLAATGGAMLPAALTAFNNYLCGLGPAKEIKLYGNGADFDNPILRCAYDAAEIKPYAGTYGGRCYRTLKSLDELFGPLLAFEKIERQGTYHNALDDAKNQAIHLMRNVARVREILTR